MSTAETHPPDGTDRAGHRIRPARPEDIPAIQRIEREADTQFAAFGHPEMASGACIPTPVAEQAVAEGRIVVADCAGEVVGWAYWGSVDGERCLGQISVSPRHSRRGIGTALLQRVIDRAKADGEASIVLNTQDDVPWNRPWYERHGFSVIPREMWSAALAAITAAQTADGLDWSTRAHMRLVLSQSSAAGAPALG